MNLENKKKKGFFSILKESMMKTGGCCGPGETCGGSGKTGAPVVASKKAVKEIPEEASKEVTVHGARGNKPPMNADRR